MLHSYCIHVHELTNMFGTFAVVCGQLTYSVHLWSSGRVSKFIVHLDEAIRFFAF